MQQGMHGIQLLPRLVELFLLLFVDDIVLISDTPRGLQNQLDVQNQLEGVSKTNLSLQRYFFPHKYGQNKSHGVQNTKSGISMERILKLSMNILIWCTHLPQKNKCNKGC